MLDREEIAKLSPQERVAGYLAASANLAVLGARLRTKYAAVRTDHSEGWTAEETAEWDALGDVTIEYHYALTEEEHEQIAYVEAFVLGPLTCAHWPLPAAKIEVFENVKDQPWDAKFEVGNKAMYERKP